MENCYEVTFGNKTVGKVVLQRQGLYCRVICHCHAPQDQVLRLYVDLEGRRENLGVVIPDGDGFILDKKIPAKRLGQGKFRFLLSSGCGSTGGRFVPICPEEPFAYITRLKNAFLESEHGKVGIRIEEHPEAV